VPRNALLVTGTRLVGKGRCTQSEQTDPDCHNDGNDTFHGFTPRLLAMYPIGLPTARNRQPTCDPSKHPVRPQREHVEQTAAAGQK